MVMADAGKVTARHAHPRLGLSTPTDDDEAATRIVVAALAIVRVDGCATGHRPGRRDRPRDPPDRLPLLPQSLLAATAEPPPAPARRCCRPPRRLPDRTEAAGRGRRLHRRRDRRLARAGAFRPGAQPAQLGARPHPPRPRWLGQHHAAAFARRLGGRGLRRRRPRRTGGAPAARRPVPGQPRRPARGEAARAYLRRWVAPAL